MEKLEKKNFSGEGDFVTNGFSEEVKLPRFANLLYDDWFKRSFGTERGKGLLMRLLQTIIPERNIAQVELQNTEHINLFAEKADIRIDVECTSEDGSRFIVELQRSNQMYFGNRMLYYSSFAVLQQLQKGQNAKKEYREFDFPPSYVIALMDFDFHERKFMHTQLVADLPEPLRWKSGQAQSDVGENEYVFRYVLEEVNHPGDYLSDKLQIILLELPRVTKAQADIGTSLQKFCYYLRNMPYLDEIPERNEDELLNLLCNSAETSTFTDEERAKYIKIMTTERDIRNQIAYSRYEGREEGREEGRKEGRKEGLLSKALEVAKNMLQKGLPVDVVVECTGLSREQVATL